RRCGGGYQARNVDQLLQRDVPSESDPAHVGGFAVGRAQHRDRDVNGGAELRSRDRARAFLDGASLVLRDRLLTAASNIKLFRFVERHGAYSSPCRSSARASSRNATLVSSPSII